MKLEQLKSQLISHLDAIKEVAQTFPWEDKKYYAMWLRQTYGFVCHSTRLLSLSAAYAKEDSFHLRFMDHTIEEKSHEKLIETDFRKMNLKISDFPELMSTKGIYQPQYYFIQHCDPIALFGYVLLLEGLAVHVGAGVFNKVKQAHTDSACHFIKIHVNADEDHLPKAFKALEAASDNQINNISIALEQTSKFYHQSLLDILEGRWQKIVPMAS